MRTREHASRASDSWRAALRLEPTIACVLGMDFIFHRALRSSTAQCSAFFIAS
ncbi:hypothetical protein PTSG_12241 [Salpingoeca rosetta]|uniref:Uncharacterized protein n=1 Tax=Salpingoeca rosetta (strain ATCC 50818 / BSB-021) TaxID=946362 RepID=F2U996_SALR5|nr:uncharacterized protein PTSG_12241 [Salpingoeca rosetta]EGD73299.1 hypothetical protein PTSG_12241 [Salpingoeca rosetta]|eukprot:XP_004994330.1 hypothetical protein PTSG_12241 [Salpingoeca rosetta]